MTYSPHIETHSPIHTDLSEYHHSNHSNYRAERHSPRFDAHSQKILASLDEHLAMMQRVRETQLPAIHTMAERLVRSLTSGGKILVFGNGGSAADSQHLVAELVGRFERQRIPLAAIALTCNTSTLTAVGNDYGYHDVFARQVTALASAPDILLGISTSGNSENIVRAIRRGHELGCTTCALTGKPGSPVAQAADFSITIPSKRTARIQEAHITVVHILCEYIDMALAD